MSFYYSSLFSLNLSVVDSGYDKSYDLVAGQTSICVSKFPLACEDLDASFFS